MRGATKNMAHTKRVQRRTFMLMELCDISGLVKQRDIDVEKISSACMQEISSLKFNLSHLGWTLDL